LEGVWPLALSLDTVGPMARNVAGLVLGMELLEPGFAVAEAAPATVGRFRPAGVDPEIDAALDQALAQAELDVVDIDLPGFEAACASNGIVLVAEAWEVDGHLLGRRQQLGDDVVQRLELGSTITAETREQAEAARV